VRHDVNAYHSVVDEAVRRKFGRDNFRRMEICAREVVCGAGYYGERRDCTALFAVLSGNHKV
jgi:hypothetical protein